MAAGVFSPVLQFVKFFQRRKDFHRFFFRILCEFYGKRFAFSCYPPAFLVIRFGFLLLNWGFFGFPSFCPLLPLLLRVSKVLPFSVLPPWWVLIFCLCP